MIVAPASDGARAMWLGRLAVARLRRSARGVLRAVVDAWADDIAQEVAILIVMRWRRGDGNTGLRIATATAIRSIFGQASGHRHRGGDTFAAVVRSAPREPSDDRPDDAAEGRDVRGVIALWRLQRMWPTLTAIQQASIFCELTGGDFCQGRGPRKGYAATVAARVDDPRGWVPPPRRIEQVTNVKGK